MESPNLFIGIDPGKKGGIAATTGKLSICSKCPDTVADMAALLSSIVDMGNRPICTIEHVHSFPGNSARSMFTFGSNYGMWLGILASLKIPYLEVTPSKWMKHYSALPKDKKARKTKLKHLAQQRYPELHITLDTSDAVLLAHYSFTNYKQYS